MFFGVWPIASGQRWKLKLSVRRKGQHERDELRREQRGKQFHLLNGYTEAERAIVSHVLKRHLPRVVRPDYNFWLIYKLYSVVSGEESEQYVARRMQWPSVRAICAPTAVELAGKLERHYLDATDPEVRADLDFQKVQVQQSVTSKETSE